MDAAEHSSPHDALFRSIFSEVANARGLIRLALSSEQLSVLDLSTLKLEPGSFVDHELRATHQDLLFATKANDNDALVYVLAETRARSSGSCPSGWPDTR